METHGEPRGPVYALTSFAVASDRRLLDRRTGETENRGAMTDSVILVIIFFPHNALYLFVMASKE